MAEMKNKISSASITNSKDGEKFLQQFHQKDLGYDECNQVYNTEKAVNTYHGLKEIMKYEGPAIIANMLAGLIPDITNAKILDLAAGTGLVGEGLYERGFRNIDAHDGAAAMVDFCRTSGFYKDFFTCFVGNGQKLPMADHTYDGMSCSGATLINHLPPSSQPEIARVIKPGGFFVNAYRADLYETEVDYGKEWREEAQRLEKNGTWTLYGVLNFPRFNKEMAGRIDVYQILK
ncbi:hypothetical protein EGW08_021246 [Elysia chlorotica]|uniref:Methyltransferase type 11 domain-containing protein n=1 Tax=Elysia chlorotica TaxID=188477 RepID=A0A433SPC6_ELYCH|nr:hypothetical protein EGW08_021246 [Elysia chlorotica]